MQASYPRAGAVAALLAALALPACSPDTQVDTSGGQPRTTAPPSPAASTVPALTPAPATPSRSTNASSPAEAAILKQYRAFFNIRTPAARAAPVERRKLLGKVAVEPSLSRTL